MIREFINMLDLYMWTLLAHIWPLGCHVAHRLLESCDTTELLFDWPHCIQFKHNITPNAWIFKCNGNDTLSHMGGIQGMSYARYRM